MFYKFLVKKMQTIRLPQLLFNSWVNLGSSPQVTPIIIIMLNSSDFCTRILLECRKNTFK